MKREAALKLLDLVDQHALVLKKSEASELGIYVYGRTEILRSKINKIPKDKVWTMDASGF